MYRGFGTGKFGLATLAIGKEFPVSAWYMYAMQIVRKLLNAILWLGGVVFVVSGVASFADVQKSLGSLGVIVLTNTEANELAAIYGGLFMVMGALCFFARDRARDRELTGFVGFSFIALAAARLYAAFRYGMPESPRIYVEFCWELLAGTAILFLNWRLKKE